MRRMTTAIVFMLFVGCFMFPKFVGKAAAAAPVIVGYLVALGLLGWVLGFVLQLLGAGAVSTPYGG